MANICRLCGLNMDLVGRVHNCHPIPRLASYAGAPKKRAGRGRPIDRDMDKTVTATKPWLALGMSRRTWYRRKREEKAK